MYIREIVLRHPWLSLALGLSLLLGIGLAAGFLYVTQLFKEEDPDRDR